MNKIIEICQSLYPDHIEPIAPDSKKYYHVSKNREGLDSIILCQECIESWIAASASSIVGEISSYLNILRDTSSGLISTQYYIPYFTTNDLPIIKGGNSLLPIITSFSLMSNYDSVRDAAEMTVSMCIFDESISHKMSIHCQNIRDDDKVTLPSIQTEVEHFLRMVVMLYAEEIPIDDILTIMDEISDGKYTSNVFTSNVE